MHVPEFAQGSYALWNVDYKDVSKEDKRGNVLKEPSGNK